METLVNVSATGARPDPGSGVLPGALRGAAKSDLHRVDLDVLPLVVVLERERETPLGEHEATCGALRGGPLARLAGHEPDSARS